MGLDKKEMIEHDAQRLYEEVLRVELLSRLQETNLYGDLSALFPTYQAPKTRFSPRNTRAFVPYIIYLALSVVITTVVIVGYNFWPGHQWFAIGFAAFAGILIFLSRRNWYLASEQDLPKPVTVLSYVTSSIVISATLAFGGLLLFAMSANALEIIATSR